MLKTFFALIVTFQFCICQPSAGLKAQNLVSVEETDGFDPLATYSPAQLKEDILFLRNAFEEAHPSLYRYTTKQAFDSLFEIALSRADTGMNYTSFIRLITPVVTAARCAHTVIMHSESYNDFSLHGLKTLPLSVKYLDGRLYVRRNYSEDSSIPEGSEISKIQGQGVSQLVQEIILPAYSNDGFNLTSGMRWMDGEGFREMYALHIASPDVYELELVLPSGERSNVSLRALFPAQQKSNRDLRYPGLNKEPDPLALEIDKENNTAFLTLRTFWRPGITAAGQNFELFLDSAFLSIREQVIPNLVIDLRGNRGGSTNYGSWLFSYLTDSVFRYTDTVEMKAYLKISFNKGKQLGDSSHYLPLPSGRYSLPTHPETLLMQPARDNFQDRVYILIDGGTFSAAGIFSAVAHARGRAIFIGEESGSNYNSLNGQINWATLPNTKAKVAVPIQQYKFNSAYPNPFPGRGVIPDYTITPSISDLVNGIDTEKEFVKLLIKRSGQ
jgi:hypothetical protein